MFYCLVSVIIILFYEFFQTHHHLQSLQRRATNGKHGIFGEEDLSCYDFHGFFIISRLVL